MHAWGLGSIMYSIVVTHWHTHPEIERSNTSFGYVSNILTQRGPTQKCLNIPSGTITLLMEHWQTTTRGLTIILFQTKDIFRLKPSITKLSQKKIYFPLPYPFKNTLSNSEYM